MTRSGPAGRPLQVVIEPPVAWVRLDRVERRNAVSIEMVEQMYDVLRELSGHDELSVVVLTGNGPVFSPGADLNAGRDGNGRSVPALESLQSARLLHEMPQLTVAAVNGGCAGAAMAWATACDLRVASSAAKFNTALLQVGLSGELGMLWTLRHHLGAARARELCFLPGKFDAAHALSIGLVSRVFDAATWDTDIASFVAELASRDVHAVRTMKQNFADADTLGLGDYIETEGRRHQSQFTGDAAADTFARLAARGSQVAGRT